MSQPSEQIWFITGTSRGIGLEMSKQLLETPDITIVAACRSPEKATALQTLAKSNPGRLHIVSIEITDEKSVRKCVEHVSSILNGNGIDYLINNAAINPGDRDVAFSMEAKTMLEVFGANVVGTTLVSQAFLSLLEKGTKKTIVNITSTFGSMGADLAMAGASAASYSISKAALNMLTYKQAKEQPELTVICMCPGWLQTDMGGPTATGIVSVGVAGVVKQIKALKHQDTAQFINWKGERVPW